MAFFGFETSLARALDLILIESIERVFRFTLGEDNAMILFNYLEKRACPLQDIPQKLGMFSTELRRVFTSDENRLDRSCQDAPCSASILEEAILRMLCLILSRKNVKLNEVHLDKLRNADFKQFLNLKYAYLAQEGGGNAASSLESSSGLIINGGEASCRKERRLF